MRRYLYKYILSDLKKKMVLLTGPRQVGKTFLAKQLMAEFQNPQYLNFDNIVDKKIIFEQTWRSDSDLLIFDEIHKMKEWKNYIKGVFDSKSQNQSILVTGSARLETHVKSGDSLAGRYYHYRLNPITIGEVESGGHEYSKLEKLNKFGGFPEPFLNSINLPEEEAVGELNRWQNQYYANLIREDILDFSKILEISAMRDLVEILRRKVGSPLSYQSLSQTLQKSPNTVKKYIFILESLYIIFLIKPFHKRINRALLKEPKFYFYDSSFIKADPGIILENSVAVSLLKYSQFLVDSKGINTSLHYIRTKEKKGIDFLLTEDDIPKTFLEVKLSDKKVSKQMLYFKNRFPNSRFVQLVHNLKQEKDENNIQMRKAAEWLNNLESII